MGRSRRSSQNLGASIPFTRTKSQLMEGCTHPRHHSSLLRHCGDVVRGCSCGRLAALDRMNDRVESLSTFPPCRQNQSRNTGIRGPESRPHSTRKAVIRGRPKVTYFSELDRRAPRHRSAGGDGPWEPNRYYPENFFSHPRGVPSSRSYPSQPQLAPSTIYSVRT